MEIIIYKYILTHNEGKSVVAGEPIRTFKNKIYKHEISISKNMYIDKWNNTVAKYNSTYLRTTKWSLLM